MWAVRMPRPPRCQVAGDVSSIELWADERADAFARTAAPWRTGAAKCRIVEAGPKNVFGCRLQLL
jgi:hypothetical protein